MRWSRMRVAAATALGAVVAACVMAQTVVPSPQPIPAPTQSAASPALESTGSPPPAHPSATVISSDPPAATDEGPTAKEIATGYTYSCALIDKGSVLCWGSNHGARVLGAEIVGSLSPVEVPELASGVTAIAAGTGHACALVAGGSVMCWGGNGMGQLGNGAAPGADVPVPADVTDLESVAAVAAGAYHTCALTREGAVKCWGNNATGALGDGSTIDSGLPIDVAGLGAGVSAIAAGNAHTCALTDAGLVRCWGGNFQGQLGNGSATSSSIPVDVPGLSAIAIAAGAAHTCALSLDGGVYCWGWGQWGQLGNGATTSTNAPVAVSALAQGVMAITTGGRHTCALRGGGNVDCWGYNSAGRLGDGSTADSSVPVAVSGLVEKAIAISAGNAHTCAVLGNGAVNCWGFNGSGQLGTGNTTDSKVPVEVMFAGRDESQVWP